MHIGLRLLFKHCGAMRKAAPFALCANSNRTHKSDEGAAGSPRGQVFLVACAAIQPPYKSTRDRFHNHVIANEVKQSLGCYSALSFREYRNDFSFQRRIKNILCAKRAQSKRSLISLMRKSWLCPCFFFSSKLFFPRWKPFSF